MNIDLGLLEEARKAVRKKQDNDTLYTDGTGIRITYLRSLVHRFTFSRPKVKAWVESVAAGKVLNLYCGPTLLECDETRNDTDPEMESDYNMDAKSFIDFWVAVKKPKFDTIILDPPYNTRKAMEKYKGHTASSFGIVKQNVTKILSPGGAVITFGYTSMSMGRKAGFKQEELLIIGHGGSVHDSIGVLERWVVNPKTNQVF